MCKCLTSLSTTTEKFLKSRIEEKHEVASYEETGFENRMIMFEKKYFPIALPFKIKYYKKKKNGESEIKLTTVSTNIIMSFCPFCGEEQIP